MLIRKWNIKKIESLTGKEGEGEIGMAKTNPANTGYGKMLLKRELRAVREENKRLREALERIQTWAKAYLLKAFPKPDLKKAHEILKAAGMTLDAISADNMRHVLDGVKDIVEQALKEK